MPGTDIVIDLTSAAIKMGIPNSKCELFRSASGANTYSVAQTQSGLLEVNHRYIVTGVPVGTSLDFKATCTNSYLTSLETAVQTLGALTPPTQITPPPTLAYNHATKMLDVTWTSAGAQIQRYYIEFKQNSDPASNSFVELDECPGMPANVLACSVDMATLQQEGRLPNLLSGEQIQVRIKGKNTLGDGPYSNFATPVVKVSGKPLQIPQITVLQSSSFDKEVYLKVEKLTLDQYGGLVVDPSRVKIKAIAYQHQS